MKLVMQHHFDSAHHLPDYDGPCNRLHGHRWDVEIEIEGEVNKETGMLIDFTVLKKVINRFDHRNLNDYFINPTAENIVVELRNLIKHELNGNCDVKVRLWESPGCMVEV